MPGAAFVWPQMFYFRLVSEALGQAVGDRVGSLPPRLCDPESHRTVSQACSPAAGACLCVPQRASPCGKYLSALCVGLCDTHTSTVASKEGKTAAGFVHFGLMFWGPLMENAGLRTGRESSESEWNGGCPSGAVSDSPPSLESSSLKHCNVTFSYDLGSF